jgi:hypothetical protein
MSKPKLAGKYKMPFTEIGDVLYCERHGYVKVKGISDAPIQWPCLVAGGRLVPVLCGELVMAVRRESEKAVAYHWGISRYTVRRWRKALGVPRFTSGTIELWRDLVDVRLSPEARSKGGRAKKVRRAS